MWTPHRFYMWGGPFPPGELSKKRQEFNIKPPLGAPLLIFPRGYLLESFPQVDNFTRQHGFEIRVSPLLGELPKAIEPNLSAFQLYRWQLDPNMWSSSTTKSLDPIVATALRAGFPWESHGPVTCGFVCYCLEPEAWTTEALGLAREGRNTISRRPIKISPKNIIIIIMVIIIMMLTM